MPKFGYYEVLGGAPVTTWSADFITHKGGQVELWNQAPSVGEEDVLIAVVSLEKGKTVSNIELTEVTEQPVVYRAIFDGGHIVHDILTGSPIAAPSE
jgi:hypothetical protein